MGKELKRRQLPRDLALAVRLAGFCAEYGLPPSDVGQLVLAARQAFRAGERDCNTGSEASGKAYERATDVFEAWATTLGFKVQWPGLWPTLLRDGKPCRDLPIGV